MSNKRSFFTGRNPAKPTLALSAFDATDRERVLDAVHCHLRVAAGESEAQLVRINQFTIERDFAEKLKVLTPQAWVTYLLIVINVLAWLATLHFGGGWQGTPVGVLFSFGGNAASEVQRGEWWRPFSAIFLHGSALHIAMNMLGLYTAGVTVERIYGPLAYVLIYLGSGLLGSALSLHFSAQHAVSVGASGAVFGVTGALLVAVIQNRRLVPEMLSKRLVGQLGFFILYSLAQGFAKQGIDNAAHIGGLIGGCMLALILPVRLDMSRYRSGLPSRAAVALVVATTATALLVVLAPRAIVDQRRIFASAAQMAYGFKEFGAVVKAMQSDQEDFREAHYPNANSLSAAGNCARLHCERWSANCNKSSYDRAIRASRCCGTRCAALN